jgi:hypothetical protein
VFSFVIRDPSRNLSASGDAENRTEDDSSAEFVETGGKIKFSSRNSVSLAGGGNNQFEVKRIVVIAI